MGVKFLGSNESFSRYSVIIPKAVVKKVTERNRYRRIIFDELSRLKPFDSAQGRPTQNADIILRVFRVTGEAALRKNTQDIIQSIQSI